jgi:hypothetical protein
VGGTGVRGSFDVSGFDMIEMFKDNGSGFHDDSLLASGNEGPTVRFTTTGESAVFAREEKDIAGTMTREPQSRMKETP